MAAAPRRRRGLPSIVSGGLVLGAIVAFSIFGPLVARHAPNESDFVHGVSPDQTPVGPCAWFPLGADRLFRDVLTRAAVAGRLSLGVAVSATLIATTVGAAVGLVAGWCEGRPVRVPWSALAGLAFLAIASALGRPAIGLVLFAVAFAASIRFRPGPRIDVDAWLMRLVDVCLALPFVLLVLAVGAALEHTSALTVCLTLGLTGWLGIARLLRAKTMQVRSLEYVDAARALGRSTPGILLRHVLPNVSGAIGVSATVLTAQMVVADSLISYLGAGIAPPTATWGRMILEGQDDYLTAPWLVATPAVAILVTVWGLHTLSEGLRDALDPRET